MPIRELKEIISNQKTVSTSRLEDIASRIERLYIQQGQKINRQSKALSEANKQYQREKQKADRREEAVQQLERLKTHHRNLTREFNMLKDKQEGQA